MLLAVMVSEVTGFGSDPELEFMQVIEVPAF